MDTIDTLISEYNVWLETNRAPKMSADELLAEDMGAEHRQYLRTYIARWEDASRREQVEAIAAKWVALLGCGFHPDTRGKDYIGMSSAQAADYERDMGRLFTLADDPYAVALAAMQAAEVTP